MLYIAGPQRVAPSEFTYLPSCLPALHLCSASCLYNVLYTLHCAGVFMQTRGEYQERP